MRTGILRFVFNIIKHARAERERERGGGGWEQLVPIAFITIRVITAARDKKQEQS